MRKYKVRLCREVTEYADIVVEAEDREAAWDKAYYTEGLEWDDCEGNEYVPYLADDDDIQEVEPLNRIDLYHKLHDGLSDMIESGRLDENDIPDDYQWLVESLAQLAGGQP